MVPVLKNIVQCMQIKLTLKNFIKTIKLGEFKVRGNVRLSCDDIPHTSGNSIKYKLALSFMFQPLSFKENRPH